MSKNTRGKGGGSPPPKPKYNKIEILPKKEKTAKKGTLAKRRTQSSQASEQKNRESQKQNKTTTSRQRKLRGSQVKFAYIRNSYMYGGNEGVHPYAVYRDKETKEVRAVGITHLYVMDKRREEALNGNLLMYEQFKEYDTPSGVKNHYRTKTANGTAIDLKNENVTKITRVLPRKQAKRIKEFAKKEDNG